MFQLLCLTGERKDVTILNLVDGLFSRPNVVKTCSSHISSTEVFIFVLSVPYKYYLVQQGKNWSDALTYCRANYIDLATIKSNDDMIKLQNEAQKQKFTSNAWIGLYNDINSWRWSMGNQPLGYFTHWCGSEPNYGMEDCAALNHWCWFDVPCMVAFPFVCFDGEEQYIHFTILLEMKVV